MSNMQNKVVDPATGMQACWIADNVGKAIQNTANLTHEGRNYFLASHAPINRIVDDRTKEVLGEAEYFDLIFKSAHRNVQAIVYGEPGTGKSHLIHWLKLRCEEVITSDSQLKDIKCILIERRNGSFKDALEQIVEQLGSSFASYLEKIHVAIRQISSETARKSLAQEFRLELSSRRADRDLPPLTGDLKYLSECFVAPGFGDWLTRDEGAIAKLLSRLTEASSVEDRQTMPEFSAADFLPSGRHQQQNPPIVRELIDQFAEDQDLCKEASNIANEVARDAVLAMTGLSASDLQTVFFDIRRELARNGKRLVLLIEDVSVYASLDRELVMAFEPQSREGLCDLKVVFGMTGPGMEAIMSLPDNQKQRITYIHSLSRSETQWGDDPSELSRFIARYLNTIRMEETRVQGLAASRIDGSDVTVSACDTCPFGITAECHERFGAVELAPGTKVGLFPFTATTASRFFEVQRLRTQTNISQTPRSLLTQLVFHGLANPDSVPSAFPPLSIPIPATALPYWTAFEQQYCGSWTPEERKRAQRLASVWLDASSAEDAAEKFEPIRGPFRFPIFSRTVTKTTPVIKPLSVSVGQTQTPVAPTSSPILLQQLANIEEWFSGKTLVQDTVPRDLLIALLKRSISWQDVRELPPKERQRLLTKDIIQIEDQRVAARGAIVRFPRTEETANLLRALVQFEYAGMKSWDFEGGQRYKRIVASWIRHNREDVIAALSPKVPELKMPWELACQYIAFLYMASQRKRLPVDRPAELIAAVFGKLDLSSVTRLSMTGRQIFGKIAQAQQILRDWLASELSSPQGDATASVFIDPRPILKFFRDFSEVFGVPRLPEVYSRDVAAARYAPLMGLPSLDSFWTDERTSLADLRRLVVSYFGEDENDEESLSVYCKELIEIKSIQERKESGFVYPDIEFDPIWKERLFQTRVETWDAELRRSQKVLSSESHGELAVYAPDVLQQLKTALSASEHYLDGIQGELRKRLEATIENGDPDEFARSLSESLNEIATLGGSGDAL
jgi:hypothetical protein